MLTKLINTARQENEDKTMILFVLGALFLWFFVVIYLFNQFPRWNKPYGIYRGGLVFSLGVMFSCFFYFKDLIKKRLKVFNDSSLVRLVSLVVCIGMLYPLLHEGLKNYKQTKQRNNIHMDQGNMQYGAYLALKKGVNPYNVNHLLTPLSINYYVTGLVEKKPECLRGYDLRFFYYIFNNFVFKGIPQWKIFSHPEVVKKIMPPKPKVEGCEKIRPYHYFSYAYGPFGFLTYSPFFSIWGIGGVAICPIFFLFLVYAAILIFFRDSIWRNPIPLVLFTIILSIPYNLMWQQFIFSSSDFVATSYALLALIFFIKYERTLMFPLLLALSVASKFPPGILLVPLLLQREKKEWACFILLVSGIYFFFYLWRNDDPTALLAAIGMGASNMFLWTNSLMYFIPNSYHLYVKILVLLFCVYLVAQLVVKKRTHDNAVFFVFIAICLGLLQGGTIQQNYITWLQMIGGFCIFVWTNRIGFQEHQAIQYRWVNNLVEKYFPRLSWHRLKEHFAK